MGPTVSLVYCVRSVSRAAAGPHGLVVAPFLALELRLGPPPFEPPGAPLFCSSLFFGSPELYSLGSRRLRRPRLGGATLSARARQLDDRNFNYSSSALPKYKLASGRYSTKVSLETCGQAAQVALSSTSGVEYKGLVSVEYSKDQLAQKLASWVSRGSQGLPRDPSPRNQKSADGHDSALVEPGICDNVAVQTLSDDPGAEDVSDKLVMKLTGLARGSPGLPRGPGPRSISAGLQMLETETVCIASKMLEVLDSSTARELAVDSVGWRVCSRRLLGWPSQCAGRPVVVQPYSLAAGSVKVLSSKFVRTALTVAVSMRACRLVAASRRRACDWGVIDIGVFEHHGWAVWLGCSFFLLWSVRLSVTPVLASAPAPRVLGFRWPLAPGKAKRLLDVLPP